MSEAIGTGDPSKFIAMSSSRCANCRVVAKNLTNAYSDGGYIRGGEWTVRSAVFESDNRVGSIWRVGIATARERWFDGNDDAVKVVDASMANVALAIERSGDSWQIREMRLR